jgi:hypothetical protein
LVRTLAHSRLRTSHCIGGTSGTSGHGHQEWRAVDVQGRQARLSDTIEQVRQAVLAAIGVDKFGPQAELIVGDDLDEVDGKLQVAVRARSI